MYDYYGIYIVFYSEKSVAQFKRKVFNIFELTGILGGIFEIFDV